jgi:hypothetical protein
MEWGVVVLIRLVIPLLILRWSLFGSVLAIIADNFDVVILDFLGVKEFAPYNRVDKFLDTYFYLIAGYTILFWKNTFAKRVGIFLLVYRLIGVVIYELTDFRFLLFVFPNLFIFFYMYYLIFRRVFKKEPFVNWVQALPALTILLILKLIHEYMLHVAQFPIYQWIKDHLFIF